MTLRELKFRAWKMHYGKLRRCVFSPFGLIEYAQKHPEAPVLHNENVNDIRDFMPNADVIEQYTGLKDKNGKEIYEGDIVKNIDSKFGDVGVIKFSEKISRFSVYWGMNPYMAKEINLDGMFVIGNIHENPELLEEKE